ncbi:cilia- and flagella-associated protein 263 [Prorops nasuta]|uniref:cilia- and flagella-associated protein 263 n=1 Tax=Prorops nasuta TaxID=863751 RepID=UPI0034CEF927
MSYLQSSSLSQPSFDAETVHKQDEEDNFNDFSNEELRFMIEQVFVNNQLLQLENNVFEKYLSQNDPQSLQAVVQILETVKITTQRTSGNLPLTPVASIDDSNGSLQEKGSFSLDSGNSESQRIANRPAAAMMLPLTQRMEMLDSEIQEMEKQLQVLTENINAKKAVLEARKDEIEIRAKETFSAIDEFEKKLIQKGFDQLTGKVPAEKFLKFVNDRIKSTDIMIEQLKLRTVTVKSKIKKTQYHLLQKELLGEDLRPVDFQVFLVENQHFAKEHELKNKHFLRAKACAAKLDIGASAYKRRLNDIVDKFSFIKKQIALKEQQIDRLKRNRKIKINELRKEEDMLISLLKLLDSYKVPTVMEYIELKSELQDVHKNYTRLVRKKNILQMKEKYKNLATLTASKL